MRRFLTPWLVPLRNRLNLTIKRWLTVRHVNNDSLESKLITRDISGLGALQYEKSKRPLPGSLHELLNYRTSKKILSDRKLPEWELNNKILAQKFVKSLDIAVPKNYQHNVPCRDISYRNNSVIKPYQGASSQGIYIYKNEKNIVNVATNEVMTSKKQLEKDLKSRRDDRWIVEEYIHGTSGKPAKNIKFYCFYGSAFLALEKSDNGKFCFWDVRSRTILDAGVYPKEKLFQGDGFNKQTVDIAEKISAEIPAPFVRIDLLVADQRVVFGEFTPRPGSFDKFNDELDRRLGVEFVTAEDRLYNDLFDGKAFDTYKNTLKQVK